MVLHQNRHDHPSPGGATLDRARLNEVITHIAFGGRRRRAVPLEDLAAATGFRIEAAQLGSHIYLFI